MVKRYLSLVSLAEALRTVEEAFFPAPRTGLVPLDEARGRVTAGPIFARFSVPERHLSAMDGIAVRSADTAGASEQRPVLITRAERVNTGNLVPPGFDAVVMIEHVQEVEGGSLVRSCASPWQHIRPVGEDIGESEMILPSRHLILPHEIGALATYGIAEVEVLELSAGLIPTGSELVPPGTRPLPGQVVESNMHMARAFLEELGVAATITPLIPDRPEAIRAALKEAVAAHDLVIISAGTSKGTRDYTASIIAELGEVLVHGIAIKPAKPVIIGKVEGRPVIGMPGYPLACYTILRELIRPLLASRGFPVPGTAKVSATLTTTLTSEIGTDEFVLLAAGRIGSDWVAVPQSRGAGVQMSLVRANAYLRIPAELEGIAAGSTVNALLTVPPSIAESALLITGSHDPALDHLADLASRSGVALHSTHAGSMGGLLSLKRHQCHAAPMHLLAPDGEYNRYYLEKYLPGEGLVLVCVAEREQGIVSREGIGLADLPGHRFANRQKGSGTRMLLDHLLAREKIDPATIPGYNRELTTHLAVALAVKTGEAEAGMCVYSAAKALGLPFVPVGTERYELGMRRSLLEEDSRLQELLRIIDTDEFRAVLTRLGGYGVRETGVRRELP
ncbi:MAG: molybdopterin biosynthesis protein [Methanomicrobiaceae archaeon]|nr:molybdopterin biosynthesis protein [Methanomicrobiaceae archaeon]